MDTTSSSPGGGWARLPITRVEDLQDAVLDAGLEAVQLSRGEMSGSLAFAACDDMTFSSGLLEGEVELVGALSETMVTLGVGVNMAPGTRHWLNEVETGGIGIFLPGDTHQALYMPGSIYACATLEPERAAEIAADMGLVLDVAQLGGSGISPRHVEADALTTLRSEFASLHAGQTDTGASASKLGYYMLEAMIRILAREPKRIVGGRDRVGYSRIVARAKDYIVANLEETLSISAIAKAAYASQSTLYRAFSEVLDETPQSYARKLRLNRIRHDLATEKEAQCSIAIIANRWGLSELGRFAGWYRELFGELPSSTRAKRKEMLRSLIAEHELRRSA